VVGWVLFISTFDLDISKGNLVSMVGQVTPCWIGSLMRRDNFGRYKLAMNGMILGTLVPIALAIVTKVLNQNNVFVLMGHQSDVSKGNKCVRGVKSDSKCFSNEEKI